MRTLENASRTLNLFALCAIAVVFEIVLSVSTVHAQSAVPNSGFYDHQIIEYESTAEVTSSVHAAQLLAKGNIVFHIVDSTGAVPAVQLARLQATLPSDATSGNVLNFIPTEVGYSGGAWNLQIFRWNPGETPVELSKDDDIFAMVSAGKGTITPTPILVRCPVINFANLR